MAIILTLHHRPTIPAFSSSAAVWLPPLPYRPPKVARSIYGICQKKKNKKYAFKKINSQYNLFETFMICCWFITYLFIFCIVLILQCFYPNLWGRVASARPTMDRLHTCSWAAEKKWKMIYDNLYQLKTFNKL